MILVARLACALFVLTILQETVQQTTDPSVDDSTSTDSTPTTSETTSSTTEAPSSTTAAPANNCSCPIRHPQEIFCDADFVFQIRTKSNVTAVNGTCQGVVSIMILNRFKSNDAANQVKKHVNQDIKIFIKNSTQCPVILEKHKDYLVSGTVENLGPLGNHFCLSSCELVVRWDDLLARQKELFQFDFRSCCDCHLIQCAGSDCSSVNKTANACVWDRDNFIQDVIGVCKREERKERNSTCEWLIDESIHHITDKSAEEHQHK